MGVFFIAISSTQQRGVKGVGLLEGRKKKTCKEEEKEEEKEQGIKPLHTSFFFSVLFVFMCWGFVLTKSVPTLGAGRTLAQCRSEPDACVMKSVTEQIKNKKKKRTRKAQKRGKQPTPLRIQPYEEDLRKIKKKKKRQTTRENRSLSF